MKIDQLKVRDLFSKAAKTYDGNSFIQAKVSDYMFSQLATQGKVSRILDIGTGTGRLSEKLKHVFPKARIFGLDFASGMLEEAKSKHRDLFLIQADAHELPFQEKSFDLVVSNVSYQWSDDLARAFTEAVRILKEKGCFLAAIFGRNTLEELRLSFMEAQSGKVKMLPDFVLPQKKEIVKALKEAGLKNIIIEQKTIKEKYPDTLKLIEWIKLTGANYSAGVLPNNLGASRILKKASCIYESRYRDNGNIYATFEVIYAQAIK